MCFFFKSISRFIYELIFLLGNRFIFKKFILEKSLRVEENKGQESNILFIYLIYMSDSQIHFSFISRSADILSIKKENQ